MGLAGRAGRCGALQQDRQCSPGSGSWQGDALMLPALASAPPDPSMGSLTHVCPRQQEGVSFPGLWLMDAVPLVTVPAEPGAEWAEAAVLSALLEGEEIVRDCRQMGLLHDETCNPSFPNAERGALLVLGVSVCELRPWFPGLRHEARLVFNLGLEENQGSGTWRGCYLLR